MTKFSIKPYQTGFDQEQTRLGFEVANLWLWPLAHDEQGLLRIHTQPNFDPKTRWCVFYPLIPYEGQVPLHSNGQ